MCHHPMPFTERLEAMSVIVLQVGKDTGAQAFLASLDTDPIIGKQIDCTR